MQVRRRQKNITLTNEEKEFVLSNIGEMNLRQISKKLEINYNKLHNNARLLGLVKDLKPKVVQFDDNGYFNIDKFAKYYNF